MMATLLGWPVVWSAGCADKAKTSMREASSHVTALGKLVERDVGEIEHGLPEGARRLAPLAAARAARLKEPGTIDDLTAVRSALMKMQRDVPLLTVAKSTFFALADDQGVAIRNNLETDAMAGTNLVSAFPALTKVLSGASYGTSVGAFPGAPGRDKTWIAASPVPKENGVGGGALVTGWTYRRFAFHLQESLKRDLREQALKSGDTGKVPVVYVAMYDRDGIYGAPDTPAVNETALAALDLPSATANAQAAGTLSIDHRDFGYAAERTPKLGDSIGVAVLRSDL